MLTSRAAALSHKLAPAFQALGQGRKKGENGFLKVLLWEGKWGNLWRGSWWYVWRSMGPV